MTKHPIPARRSTGTVAIAGVIALIFIAAAAVVALSVGHDVDESTTPLLTALLGLIGVTVPSLIALARVEEIATKVDRTSDATEELLNGGLRANMRGALKEYAEDPSTPPLGQGTPVVNVYGTTESTLDTGETLSTSEDTPAS